MYGRLKHKEAGRGVGRGVDLAARQQLQAGEAGEEEEEGEDKRP